MLEILLSASDWSACLLRMLLYLPIPKESRSAGRATRSICSYFFISPSPLLYQSLLPLSFMCLSVLSSCIRTQFWESWNFFWLGLERLLVLALFLSLHYTSSISDRDVSFRGSSDLKHLLLFLYLSLLSPLALSKPAPPWLYVLVCAEPPSPPVQLLAAVSHFFAFGQVRE